MQQQQGFTTASAAMKPGFTSVTARYDELMEQSLLKKVDKRAAREEGADQPRGQKRPGESKGSIASFFKKPCTQPAESQALSRLNDRQGTQRNRPQSRPAKAPLTEITNVQPARHEEADSLKSSSLGQYKPRAMPLKRGPTALARTDETVPGKGYVFLSSSPPQLDDDENETPEANTNNTATGRNEVHVEMKARPAATFHTTSMQAAPHRRTLGTRRSLHGWRPRGG